MISMDHLSPYSIGMDISEIETPALLLDLDIMEKNIWEMAKYFNQRPAGIRPHIKNHMSPFIAHKQMDAGAVGVCCQTVAEAEIMAYSGIKDILIANEVIGKSKIDRLLDLTRHTHMMVAVDHPSNVRDLSKAATKKKASIDVLIDLDTGYGRCGIQPGDSALKLSQLIVDSHGLEFKGINGYTPASFDEDQEEKRAKQEKKLKVDIDTRDLLIKNGIEVEMVSAGCTRDFFISADYPGITEVQPGTYIYMDIGHRELIDTTPVDLDYAMTVLTTVISTPVDDRVVVDAGSKAILKIDSRLKDLKGYELYALSAEHGKLRVNEPERKLALGEKIELIPSYGDGTVNRWSRYLGVRKGKLETVIPIYHPY
ncbi:DSD1 family PLP-dependent enzyme [Candidatus Bathyarchaeota archaeon]|jgi:D-serine deaminase-like pyridoxal phosphate-dependent protein|nr:MAG: DSD1 family PLP-dependent enzyme [Candidatus Bathyarchaeota archaeon]